MTLRKQFKSDIPRILTAMKKEWCKISHGAGPEKLQKVPVHEMCTVNPNAQNNVQDTAKNTRSEWLSATVKHVPLLHAFIGKKI